MQTLTLEMKIFFRCKKIGIINYTEIIQDEDRNIVNG